MDIIVEKVYVFSFLGLNTTNVKRKVVLKSLDVTIDNRRIEVPRIGRTFILYAEFKISILIHNNGEGKYGETCGKAT